MKLKRNYLKNDEVSVKLQEGNGIKFHIVEKKTSPY